MSDQPSTNINEVPGNEAVDKIPLVKPKIFKRRYRSFKWDTELAFGMYARGFTLRQIAKHVGIKYDTIYKAYVKLDWAKKSEAIANSTMDHLTTKLPEAQLKLREAEHMLFKEMLSKGREMLANYDPAKKKMDAREIVVWIDCLSKLGRLSVNLPLNASSVNIQGSVSLSDSLKGAIEKGMADVIDIEQVSDEADSSNDNVEQLKLKDTDKLKDSGIEPKAES